ncbi:ABC transporter ATP-binding protein [Marinisporobacter balticus]|uniref:Iron(III) transport system ATP-binding protein/spermidine/putrescine transport system ATP-binding protein n=1 Tax=Marinisporobacter balticus TaxID=2018667 RepID=A0A4R2KVB0_9FIRM|nr:ABC transporter ATP-binding protein [Marinisporobacter balticus]TCO76862.1 iron(III) transport system ATP-binding protein/spermidine/putrescine transport system ATP-binding protein [Marinisporobacter balticus]
MEIVLKNIIKKYGDVAAVKNISLEVKQGELVALLGPSGCGKTTLLRIIAGLVPLDSGKIFFDGKDVTTWSSQQRNAAMVFQNYALFPYLNVEQNIAYGLKVRKRSKSEIEKRVRSLLERVALSGLEKRDIQELSGGQKQRVALARALVVEPNILLFDEPLSNLDEKLRVSMRQEIRKIQKDIGITSIYVTHDQKEALAIADRIVVMNKGEIQQIVKPDELYYKPANTFVASFIGHANLIEIPVLKDENNEKIAKLFGKIVKIDKLDEEIKNIIALLRPEEIKLTNEGIQAKVIGHENLGSIYRYKVKVETYEIIVDVLNRRRNRILNIGDCVHLDFDEKSVHVLYN